MDSSIVVNSSVQHVTKKSSDELLRKFAELEADSGRKAVVVVKPRRRRGRIVRENEQCDSPVGGGGVVERRRLIPAAGRNKFGIGNNGRSQPLRVRDFRNKSILGAIQKTWRRTVEGASKMLLERHYNTHRRLISDIV